MKLVTPDSEWKVQTTNVVATVWGTAFGVEYRQGRSSIIGSQNKVAVSVLDPATKKVIKEAAVVVEPDKFVLVDTADIQKIKENKKELAVQVITPDITNKEWVQDAKKADTEIDIKIQELQDQKLQDKDIRKELQKEVLQQFQNQIRARKIEQENKKRDEETLNKKPETKNPDIPIEVKKIRKSFNLQPRQ